MRRIEPLQFRHLHKTTDATCMTLSIRSVLEQEVARFRSWADNYGPVRFGEWECDYPDWTRLYMAVSDFIANSNVSDWDESIVGLLIYAIARDNECEYIAPLLQALTDKLHVLARAAVQSDENDAKWQLCEQLTHSTEQREPAESLLLAFAADDDAYVRRRAMMALGRIGSSQVETLAEKAWETGDEYQRMAALHALYNVQSEHLPSYLKMAHADGRQSVSAFADRLLRGESIE